MVPSAKDLDAWEDALKNGQAMMEMWPRFLEGYRRLLKVAEAAEKECPSHHLPLIDGWAHRTGRGKTHRCWLSENLREALGALDALRAPVPEETTR